MTKTLFKRIGFIVIGIAIVVTLWATRTGRLDPRPYHAKGALTPLAADAKWPETVIPVKVGAYVENIYDFAVQSQTFSGEGWVWLIWPQAFQDLMAAQNLTPERCLFIANSVDASNFIMKSESGPVKLQDGQYYQIFRFSGKFYADKLNFHRFPFETLRFPLVLSLNPESLFLDADHVRLVAQTAQSGVGEYINIPGYVTAAVQVGEFIYRFGTNLGMSGDHSSAEVRFSRVQMEVVYGKSVVAAILQLVLPLMIVMSVVLLAPNLAGSLWDVRVALPSTALLTLVFLQQGYRAQLPTLPYLTFLDQVYALCYGAALALFCLFVSSSNRLDQADENKKADVVEQINRTDLRFQVGLTLALAVLITLCWFFPGRV